MPEQKPVHEINEMDEEIHIDVDPVIPTGICAICSWEPPYVEIPYEETLPPEEEPIEEEAPLEPESDEDPVT